MYTYTLLLVDRQSEEAAWEIRISFPLGFYFCVLWQRDSNKKNNNNNLNNNKIQVTINLTNQKQKKGT